MLLLFDYVFYRAYRFGIGRANSPLAYAAMIVSVIQSLILISFFSIARFLSDSINPKLIYYVIGIAILLTYTTNYLRYERNPWVDEMKKRWHDEDQTKRTIRGWIIVLCIAVLVATPFTLAKMGFEHRRTSQEKIK